MRLMIVCCLVFMAIGVGTVRYIEARDTMRQSADTAAAEAVKKVSPERLSYYAKEVRIEKASNDQYYVDARINRRGLNFLVDTGAGLVALRESDARRAGILVNDNDFTHTVSTANGKTRAARVLLEEVDVDGLKVYSVDAFILPDNKLGVNLLGMSYLSRLSGMQTRQGALILKG